MLGCGGRADGPYHDDREDREDREENPGNALETFGERCLRRAKPAFMAGEASSASA